MDEFERNVVHKHHDNVTQWVNEFSKKRGWFVQVWSILINWPTDDHKTDYVETVARWQSALNIVQFI